MDDRRINPSHIPCIYHSGLEERILGLRCKIDEREKQSNLQMAEMNRALELARRELDRRLEGMNEFREQLRFQADSFTTKSEYIIEHKNLVGRITSLELAKSKTEGEKIWPNIITMAMISAGIYLLARFVFKI